MRKLTILLALAGAALFMLPGAAMAGVSGPAFYVDGEMYRTVGTPTDFSNTGAPDHSFDTIYAIDDQPNVATAAPGDPGFNGGRKSMRWRSSTSLRLTPTTAATSIRLPRSTRP